ncbi:MAG: hypothetical protein ABEJ28_02005 [Salinigranum sp.]
MSSRTRASEPDGSVGAAEGEDRTDPTRWDGVRFVGPTTARVLEAAGAEPADLTERRLTYRDLVDAGVNGGVAARLRREHSLAWTDGIAGVDLGRRSARVRGLGEAERAWVAASAGDWQSTAADADEPDGDTSANGGRERRTPDPVSVLDAVDDEAAATLAEAGITSVRCLSRIDPACVANALGVRQGAVRRWHDAARVRRE